MRIAQVCPYDIGIPGGVQAQVTGLTRALLRLGHHVDLIAPGRAAPAVSDLEVLTVGRTVGVRANGSVAPISPFPRAFVRSWKLERHSDYDVVHLHEPLVPGPTLALLSRSHTPMVGTFHRSGSSIAYRAAGPVARRLARRLELRCAVSEQSARTAAQALGGDYEVVFNGVEVDRYARAAPWPSSAPTVAFVGRHEERKGLAVLLDALDSLPVGTHVWIMGEGPETKRLRRGVGDRAGV
ncbi:MAG: glycosyltransferase family 4 protein, partial [Acidimicrobiales bacterium]